MPSPLPSQPAARLRRWGTPLLGLLAALTTCRTRPEPPPPPGAGLAQPVGEGLAWGSPAGLRFESQRWTSVQPGTRSLRISDARLFRWADDRSAPAQDFGPWFAALDSLSVAADDVRIDLPGARLELDSVYASTRSPSSSAPFLAQGRLLSLGPLEFPDDGAPLRFDALRSGAKLFGKLEALGWLPAAQLEIQLPRHERAGFDVKAAADDGSLELRYGRRLGRQRGRLELREASAPEPLGALLGLADAPRRALAAARWSGRLSFEAAEDEARPRVDFELSARSADGAQERLEARGSGSATGLDLARLEFVSPGLALTLAPWNRSAAAGAGPPSAAPGGRLSLALAAPGARRPGALEQALLEGLLPGPWIERLRRLGAQGRLEIRVDGGGRARLSGELQGPLGSWNIEALDWSQGSAGPDLEQIRLRFEQLPLASLAPALVRWPGLASRAPRSGSLGGRLELRREGQIWSGQVELKGEDLALGERPAGSLDLELGLESGRLELRSGRWRDGQLELTIGGSLAAWSPAAAVAWYEDFESGPLALLAGLWQLDPDALALEGLALELRFSGTAAAPRAELSGRARFEPRRLWAWSELLPLSPAQLELRGSGDGRAFDLSARLLGGAAQSLLLAGRLEPPAGRLLLTQLEASAGRPLLELEGPLGIDLEGGWPGSGTLRTPAGRLRLTRADAEGEQRLRVSAERLDLEALPLGASTRAGRLARLVPEPLSLEAELVRRAGRVQLERFDLDWGSEQRLRLSSQPLDGSAGASARGSLRLGAVDPERLAQALGLESRLPFGLLEGGRLALDFDLGQRLEVRNLSLTSASGALQGSLSVELSLSELLADPRRLLAAAGRIELSGGLDQLGFLAQAAPALERVSGALRFDGLYLERSARGTTGRGSVELAAGRVGFRSGFPAVSELSARLSWRDDELFLESFQGRLGAAPFQGNGRFDLLGPDAPRYEVFASGSALPIEQRRGLRLRSDATLHLSGAAGRARLAGRLEIVDGRANLAAGPTAALTAGLSGVRRPSRDWLALLAPRWPAPAGLELGLEIAAASPIDLQAGPLRLGLDPDLRLFGPAAAPSLEGAIYLRPGRLDLPAGRLQISGGALRLRPSGSAPELELAARMRQKGHDLNVSVSGTWDDPRIEVSSTPPLPPRDALVLLSTGLLPDQALTARGGNQTARLLAVYLAQDLSRSLFGPSEGERFIDRFEFAKGRDVAKDGTETLEANFLLRSGLWTPNGRLSLAGEYDVYKQVNFGVRWALRWR